MRKLINGTYQQVDAPPVKQPADKEATAKPKRAKKAQPAKPAKPSAAKKSGRKS